MDNDAMERFNLAFMIVFAISALSQLLLFIYALVWCLRNPTPHTRRLSRIWLAYSIAHVCVGIFGAFQFQTAWGVAITIQFALLSIGYWLYVFRIFLSVYDAYEMLVKRIEAPSNKKPIVHRKLVERVCTSIIVTLYMVSLIFWLTELS